MIIKFKTKDVQEERFKENIKDANNYNCLYYEKRNQFLIENEVIPFKNLKIVLKEDKKIKYLTYLVQSVNLSFLTLFLYILFINFPRDMYTTDNNFFMTFISIMFIAIISLFIFEFKNKEIITKNINSENSKMINLFLKESKKVEKDFKNFYITENDLDYLNTIVVLKNNVIKKIYEFITIDDIFENHVNVKNIYDEDVLCHYSPYHIPKNVKEEAILDIAHMENDITISEFKRQFEDIIELRKFENKKKEIDQNTEEEQKNKYEYKLYYDMYQKAKLKDSLDPRIFSNIKFLEDNSKTVQNLPKEEKIKEVLYSEK